MRWGGWGDTDCTKFRDCGDSDEYFRERVRGDCERRNDGHRDGDSELQRWDDC